MSEQDQQTARIQFRLRRGMLELDHMLKKFYEQQFHQLDDQQKNYFEQLLDNEDQDLWRWLMGIEEINNDELKPLVKLIQQNH